MKYDAIYISPHLDDVALSCGGQIARRAAAGLPVLIVTITAGEPTLHHLSPFARSLHDRWQVAAGAVALRRVEDAEACAILGANFEHWDYLDCIYRIDPADGRPLYASEKALFGPLKAADQALVHEVSRRLAELPVANKIVVPLGVGRHVDHQLTRLAAERCFDPEQLHYYPEYPYTRTDQDVSIVVNDDTEWQVKTLAVDEDALAVKIAAIACYRSQLSTFFAGEQDMARQVKDDNQQHGGERLWFRIKPSMQ
jgi:LmbE family N-acetylglucosaminyl deacetylase